MNGDGREAAGRSPRSLVVANVNDNEGARYMTTLLLRKAGFSVVEAANGAQALALAEDLPDVMVLDVQLPDVNGLEVCRRIRANPKTARIKVLHTSATFVTLEKKVQGLDGGADGYLAQPFEAEELIATVHSLGRLSSAERDLHDRASDLLEASRRKDEFLAMLAHELRNPLSAISAAVPLLCQRAPHDDREARAREILDRQTKHLARLIDDLLDVARVTSGKVELHPRTVNLSDLLIRVVATMRQSKVTPRNQSLALDMPSSAVFVQGDPTRLEQIFVNLLDNASKYTDPGGSIRVSVSRLGADAGGSVRVRVRDSGIGISAQTLPTIFDLFSQANVSIDRARGGLGVGLTLVKSLAELHGGRVAVSSDGLDEGSQFEVELPTTAPHTSTDALSGSEAETRPLSVSRRILLIEDNDDAREGLADLWQALGHRVSTAADGLEGVRRALEELPDIAFVDLGLPGLDGFEVARQIRADGAGRDLLLVALTGYSAPEQRARALEAGFDLHLVKPVDPDKVERLLSNLSGLREQAARAMSARR